MTIKFNISNSCNSKIFDAMTKLVKHIEPEVDKFCYETVAPLLEEKYNIKLHPYKSFKYNEGEDGESGHIVEFLSENDYLLFLLRWT